MKITIYGSGYVGLVAAACFAEVGNQVLCVDIDKAKVEKLQSGVCPIYEPELEDVIVANLKTENLNFTTDFNAGVAHGIFQCIAVGTPGTDEGHADLSQVFAVAEKIASLMCDEKIIVHKSTVPVGTADAVKSRMQTILTQRKVNLKFTVASNPEFLKEGTAVEDFRKPDRIIIGLDDNAYEIMFKKLYAPFNRNHDRLIFMDRCSAELSKYAANAMLATKISFMNEISNLAEHFKADIEKVRIGIGSDPRIGYHFIYPGCGYGGSCLPKDMKALIAQANQQSYQPMLLKAVEHVNNQQKNKLFEKLKRKLNTLSDKKIAIWGLSFKPGTDDIRDAPSLALIEQLISEEATIAVYDPKSMENVRRIYNNYHKIEFCDKQYDALYDADVLVILTEWRIFRSPDFAKMKSDMRQPIIIDGRNIFDPEHMLRLGFSYYGMGRGDNL